MWIINEWNEYSVPESLQEAEILRLRSNNTEDDTRAYVIDAFVSTLYPTEGGNYYGTPRALT